MEERKPYRRYRKAKTKPPNVLVGFGAALGLAGAGWLAAGQLTEPVSLTEHYPTSAQEGRAFGEGQDHRACLEEVLATVGSCGDDAACLGNNQAFLQGCAQTADLDAFCDVVPRYPSAQAEWAERQCEGVAGQGCPEVLRELLEGCRALW